MSDFLYSTQVLTTFFLLFKSYDDKIWTILTFNVVKNWQFVDPPLFVNVVFEYHLIYFGIWRYYNYFLVFYGTNFHERTSYQDIFCLRQDIEKCGTQVFLFSNKFLTNEKKPKPKPADWPKVCFQNKIYSIFTIQMFASLLDVLPKIMITELFFKTYYCFTF